MASVTENKVIYEYGNFETLYGTDNGHHCKSTKPNTNGTTGINNGN